MFVYNVYEYIIYNYYLFKFNFVFLIKFLRFIY